MFAIRKIEPQARTVSDGQFAHQVQVNREPAAEIPEPEIALVARQSSAVQDMETGMPPLARFYPARPFRKHDMMNQFTEGVGRAKQIFFAVADVRRVIRVRWTAGLME